MASSDQDRITMTVIDTILLLISRDPGVHQAIGCSLVIGGIVGALVLAYRSNHA